MQGEKLIQVVAVKALGDYALDVTFSNGQHFPVDLKNTVHRLKGLKPLRGVRQFKRVSLGEGGHSIEWPGELDIGAFTLWDLALRQNGHADAAEFILWRWRNGLSLTAAAEALGLSRRQVAYYASGAHLVPRTVLLACKGWNTEKEVAA